MNFLLKSSDVGLLQEQVDKIITATTKSAPLRKFVFDFNDDHLPEILNCLVTNNLLGEQIVVDVKNVNFVVATTAKSVNQDHYQDLVDYCRHPHPANILILECLSDRALLKNQLVKDLLANVQCFELPDLSASQLRHWIRAYVNKHHGQVTEQAITAMLERLPLKFDVIRNETGKLLNFNQPITQSLVKEQTILYLKKSVFDIAVAVLQGNSEFFLQYLDYLISYGFEWTPLLGVLNYNLAQIRSLKLGLIQHQPLTKLSKILNINYYQTQKLRRYVDNWSFAHIEKLLAIVLDLDQQVKHSMTKEKLIFEWNMLKLFLEPQRA